MKTILLLAVAASASAGPIPTPELLRRTGKAVEQFWDQLSSVDCTENVIQVKLGAKGKVLSRQESAFDYLVLLQLAGNDIVLDESRWPLRETSNANKLPLLVTNGFSLFAFVFHPAYQSAFEFSEPEPAQVEGKEFWLVRFRHVKNSRSPSVLKIREREYPIEWQGTAWVEQSSGAIARISAGLTSRMEDIGLLSLNADVRYAPVEFREAPGPHWLPAVATVEVETVKQHWRNTHTFSNYRHFSVEVRDDKTGAGAPK
jgi:hypothetical protein